MTQYPHNEAADFMTTVTQTGIVHTFDLNDERARLTWKGRPFRAVRIERDDVHGLSVWLVRTTKTGADFKRPNSFMWLTLENSLDRDPAGAALAAYVREIAEPTTEQVAEIIADSDATLNRMAPVVQCSTEPTRHAPHIWRGAGQHVDNPIRYSCPGYDGCTKCTDPIPHTHTGYHGAPVHDAPTGSAIIGAQVRFREDFSTKLVGIVFTIDGAITNTPDGRKFVSLTTMTKTGRAYRLGWVDDLRTLDGDPIEPADKLSEATNAIVQAPSAHDK